ncbi:bifunctional 3-(3-hydroxy-phenyl)propionate/3-hydroxycinnamic acid hydroxylase [Variovorax sp.]|uniref:bifunctional 3-(3-hydroxy-phenyl)propionate/3-hydroxycinnamic acid hydroxylase MhpA n=1 Tax=Variovorax sp. TaxID=1871043 RepID=UPI002D524683|nr:bifunctional 3-(3-hydroxy-phenyl)propionate/3-hydroxycinnamic acid hydroxylase [Variovorax sp.]HYP83295.1 bifunctional 3-(3-hydroxy-phenyl)propionate/3-hydroxycinnamic acid hydroxylase [Variovorax sp.]
MNASTDAAPVYDVAIVGLGPAGATLANLLALRGLRIVVFEREADIYRLPRAIHIDGECMRVFQSVGIADELLPHLFVSPGMKFVDSGGKTLIDWSRPQEVGPQGWHPSYRFHQPQVEELLRARLARHPGVDVRLRHDVFALEPHGDRVELRVEESASGRLYRCAARYVVGCDGARSLVRRVMGTTLDDLQSHERWLVLDVLLKRERPDLGDHSIQFCDPARPATYVRGVGVRRRWELMLMPGDDAATITRPEAVWPLLAKWLTPDDATLERPAVYTFHSVVARGWRNGRMLIAGDAAHQTPPFMGQGMCAGIRDAANLAWKLADVLDGTAPPALLDTYESERSPHVREFIETAVRLGGVIQTTDVEAARRRDAEMAARPQVFSTPQPALGPGAHAGGVHGGRMSSQPVLANGDRLDDRVGYRHALVLLPALAAAARAALGDSVRVVAADDAALQAWLASMAAGAVLLRPDRYIAAVATDAQGLRAMAGLLGPVHGHEHRSLSAAVNPAAASLGSPLRQ